jgi:hypothetical protein
MPPEGIACYTAALTGMISKRKLAGRFEDYDSTPMELGFI